MNDPQMLSGMRVVEASAFVAAPLGGMTLAQLGADVIRIDPLHGGLDHRRWPVTGDDVSLFWCGLNKGKRSVSLDLANEEGREIAIALITAAGNDGGNFITNFPARGWLDYERLRARRDDLVQVTVKGDRHGSSAVDYTVNATTGLPYVTGPMGSAEAVNHVLPAWDLITGHMVAIAMLAADRERRLRGRGQHIELALKDVALAVMGHLGFIAEAQLGGERPRIGNYLFGAFARDFVTRDGGRVMVVALTLKQWRSLCGATGTAAEMRGLAERLQLDFEREGDRYQAREPIAEAVGGWIGSRSMDAVAEAFDAHGVCWDRYQSVSQLVASDPECSEANPMFTTLEQPGVGSCLVPGLPFTSSAFARAIPKPAPRLGEHTEQVLAEVLGLSDAALGKLIERKLIRRFDPA